MVSVVEVRIKTSEVSITKCCGRCFAPKVEEEREEWGESLDVDLHDLHCSPNSRVIKYRGM